MHGCVGAYIAECLLQIRDESVLSAISNHTLGRPEMSVTEKIVFVADVLDLEREVEAQNPDVRARRQAVRNLAFVKRNLDGAVRQCLLLKRSHTLAKGETLHPLAQQALDFYRT
jgi:HD superfamily phosphohydrolase YqeK